MDLQMIIGRQDGLRNFTYAEISGSSLEVRNSVPGLRAPWVYVVEFKGFEKTPSGHVCCHGLPEPVAHGSDC
jgi:hypothetical protein